METEEPKVRKHIEIHAVGGGTLTKGWIHTHGMKELGLPELELKRVPVLFTAAAAVLLNEVADYMFEVKDTDNPVKVGQTMQLGQFTLLRFLKATPIPGEEAHYTGDVWEVVSAVEELPCGLCGAVAAQGIVSPTKH